MDGLSTADIIGRCRSLDPKDWQKRFEDDLVAVLSQTGYTPGKSATLALKELSSGNAVTLKDVPLTEANRMAAHDYRAERIIMGK